MVAHRRCLRKYAKPWKKKMAADLRKHMTESEKKLWERLRGRKLGVSVYAQSIVYGYILDFWMPSSKLCIEIDGSVHDRRKVYDKRRDGHLREMGIKTIRFSVDDVRGNVRAVVAIIKFEIAKRK